jgi:RNA polymerase sigma factor (sigma-70 family)
VLPSELSALLGAEDPAARDAAWKSFVELHSRLLLHTARSVDRDHDAAMDAYTHLLEQLRADDFRRLRGYADDGRSKFTTWLVVVARRLCLDHVRQRYGRLQEDTPEARESHAARRRLIDHVTDEIDVDELHAEAGVDADAQLRTAELTRALSAALAGLDPSDRLLLRLRFEDDLPAREIAAILHYPSPFHVYRRINALLAQMRETLARRGVREAEP